MKAIILAAGTGMRLGSITENRPKALVPVADRELLLRVFDFLHHPAITHKSIVIGYCEPLFRNFLKEHAPGVEIFFNPDFTKGSILSLMKAFPAMTDDFLLLNVDHIYPKRMLQPIFAQPRKGIAAICDFDRKLGPDDMKVKKNNEGFLGHIHKKLPSFDGGYIGMTLCQKDSIPRYQRAAEDLLKKEGDHASVEWILGMLAEQGENIELCDVSGVRWLEVDDQNDLTHAEHILATEKDFLR